jgi:hypothetical protein
MISISGGQAREDMGNFLFAVEKRQYGRPAWGRGGVNVAVNRSKTAFGVKKTDYGTVFWKIRRDKRRFAKARRKSREQGRQARLFPESFDESGHGGIIFSSSCP